MNIKNYFWVLCVGMLVGACQGGRTTDPNQSVSWTEKANGVWQMDVGHPESFNLLSELHLTPKLDALSRMNGTELPIDQSDISWQVVDGKTYLRFPLEEGEQIYGLGLNFKTVQQRGRLMRLHVDHFGGEDDGRTHAPVPFFISSRGYGALINTARYVDVWAGTSIRKDTKHPPVVQNRNEDPDWSAQPYSDNLEFLVPAEGVEIILFGGPTMLDVVRRYNLYNGGGVLPPRWGLGFWHRVPTLFNEQEVNEEVAEFEKRGFPLTVIGLEPGWMSGSYPCTFEWDPKRFPDPDRFVKGLEEKQIKTNVWINSYVSPKGVLYPQIEPYTASHTVWNGVVPDYTMKEARQIMRAHLEKYQVDKGVSGYKMDENDGFDSWLWPDVATFPSGHPAEQMRQVYGTLMQDLFTQMYRDRNQRTYGLVRASNAGASSFPFVIYNDYYNHRDFITALINSSFIGILWTPEVRASKSAEEWLRRMQTVCFSPVAMLDAWADGTKPWSFPEVNRQVSEIVNLRMQLIPYLYTAFADYLFEGIPPVRAMNLEPGYEASEEIEAGVLDATDNPYAMAVRKESKDQFMVGPSLLVAPLFTGEKSRQVVLPKGKWYDFYTGAYVGDGEVITAQPEMDRIPLYVKEGGIIPLWPAVTKLTGEKLPVEVRHYGTTSSSYELYDDDGETYDYEKGDYARIRLEVTVDAQGHKTSRAICPTDRPLWSFSEFNFQE